MREDTGALSDPIVGSRSRLMKIVLQRETLLTAAILVLLFLAFYHLTAWPLTWFDEGSHLHVPKTLVRFGVYADYSSDGFRYYGPTVGVGPTVFLPIAAVFKLFGIGLAQARVVMALYLLAAVWAFYRMAKIVSGPGVALVASALIVTSRGVALLEYGRQVLGEVPGFFFLAAGLAIWYTAWEKPTWSRLISSGLLLGLSMVTKNQYLLVLAPTMGLAWIANWIYYRSAPQRAFLLPGFISVLVFLLWNIYLIINLGPATASQNFTMLREATQGAALVFSPHLMKQALANLLSLNVFLGLLVPALVYGLILSFPRSREGLRWSSLFILAVFNLAWYMFASIGWLRYAFPGLAVSGLFVARFFGDLTNGFRFDFKGAWDSLRRGASIQTGMALRGVLLLWLVAMIAIPLVQNFANELFPPFNAPAAMAAYMDQNISKSAVVETWEPEMGFLTDHNYHFPPPGLLNTAIGYIWLGKTPPGQEYHYIEQNLPPYVLIGSFAAWVKLYPVDFLAAHYSLVTSIGGYQLYRLRQ